MFALPSSEVVAHLRHQRSISCSFTGGRSGIAAWLDALRELAALQEEGLIGHLGVTNFDTDHLRVLVGEGIRIASNQVSFSLIDRRAAADMSAFCLLNGIRLLAYGTLAGGFLTDRWLGKPEPAADEISDWNASLEVQASSSMCIRRLGGASEHPFCRLVNRPQARCIGRQRSCALGAQPRGRGRHHRRCSPGASASTTQTT